MAKRPLAGFDNGAGCCIAGPVDIGKSQVMLAPVGALDDRIGLAGQLIVQPAINHPADDLLAHGFAMQSEARGIDLETLSALATPQSTERHAHNPRINQPERQ